MNVIFIGRMTVDKGFDSFGRLKLHKFDKIACGKGPLSGLYNDVIDFGWQNQTNIKFLLKKSSLCIYPSRQIDADPIIVKQALSLNIPVFISNHNALSDLVKEIIGDNFVINDWNIIDDQYILNSLENIKNYNFCNSLLYSNFSDLINLYYKLLK